MMAQGMMGSFAQTQAAMQPKPAVSAPAPEGSWICIECQNVNYATRMECNGRQCKQPRALVDGGPANPGEYGGWGGYDGYWSYGGGYGKAKGKGGWGAAGPYGGASRKGKPGKGAGGE